MNTYIARRYLLFAVCQCLGHRFHNQGAAGNIAHHKCHLCLEYVHSADHWAVDHPVQLVIYGIRIVFHDPQGFAVRLAGLSDAGTHFPLLWPVH